MGMTSLLIAMALVHSGGSLADITYGGDGRRAGLTVSVYDAWSLLTAVMLKPRVLREENMQGGEGLTRHRWADLVLVGGRCRVEKATSVETRIQAVKCIY